MKKFLSAIVAVVMAFSTTTLAFAAGTPSAKSDTTGTFSMKTGAYYTFKITAVNTTAKPTFSIADTKIIKLISSSKTGNDYYYKVMAIGKDGEGTGVYTALPKQNAVRQCIININNNTSVSTATPATPPTFPYGVVESSVGYITKVGILEPFAVDYDPSFSFAQHANAINKNMDGCDLVNNGFTLGNGSDAYIRFIEQDGKYGLLITAWRKSKSSNDGAGILNGALSACCYLSNDKATGIAIWSWLDASNVNGGRVDTNDYGFVDDAGGTANNWTATYKDSGAKVNVKYGDNSLTLLFTPKA